MTKRIKDLTKKMRIILNDWPQTRNDDRILATKLYQVCYPQFVGFVYVYREMKTYKIPNIALSNLHKVPSGESIARCRRKIQEGGEYLPTIQSVAERRGIEEAQWRAYMLNN